MAARQTASVAIVGGGPVGLTLALDLAWRGVDVVVAEERFEGELPSVKCNHISSRSMEIFRRLGIARALRAVGLPDDYPNDVVFRTRATGFELTRIPIPSRLNRFCRSGGPDTGWPTPEPAHRANQIFFEPVLFRQAARTHGVSLLSRTRAERFTEHPDRVELTVCELDSGRERTIECRYLIGCDGGKSTLRRQIGAKLEGDDEIQRVQSSYIRAPRLRELVTPPPAWMSYIYNPERAGNLVAIDGEQTWLVHNYLLEDERDFESVDRDRCIRALLGVASDFQYEILRKEDWTGRRLIVDRFREGRVFLCGDAAHIWVPYAGYGMNAGIADAADLAWLLAAHLAGWAPQTVLEAYELERLPITEQVSRFAMRHAEGAIRERTQLPRELEEHSPRGAAARAQVGSAAYELHVQQFACAGLNYGYFYERSPLIAYDGEPAPSYTMSQYMPSTVPGCRAPHFWLEDGRSLYDALGPDYTLLRFDPGLEVAPLVKAAEHRGVPLAVLEASRGRADGADGDRHPQGGAAPYRHGLLVVRPDQHVAWRGDRIPDDPAALIERLRGAAI
jgi:2-polyprenyl-6-methoxyphenol hydroxylase-like FAD-dependent oxidoreductase